MMNYAIPSTLNTPTTDHDLTHISSDKGMLAITELCQFSYGDLEAMNPDLTSLMDYLDGNPYPLQYLYGLSHGLSRLGTEHHEGFLGWVFDWSCSLMWAREEGQTDPQAYIEAAFKDAQMYKQACIGYFHSEEDYATRLWQSISHKEISSYELGRWASVHLEARHNGEGDYYPSLASLMNFRGEHLNGVAVLQFSRLEQVQTEQ